MLPVGLPQIDTIWPHISGYLSEACQYHPCMNADDILQLAHAGRVTLFIAVKNDTIVGATASEVARYPRMTCANIILIGGTEGDQWFDELVASTEKWAVQYGCTILTGAGRKGWIKTAPKFGFKAESRSFFSKEISGE